jgi:hypothetical protein
VLVHLAPNGRQVVERISRQLEQRVDGALGKIATGGQALSSLLNRVAESIPVAK